ncbi:hypothetical protein BC830DRAFT_1108619 [Chytriomyces sp. MP71]|nr:hypothetical protein BC830DRAFT_1108619 [Chytriomyces sp. MP71]
MKGNSTFNPVSATNQLGRPSSLLLIQKQIRQNRFSANSSSETECSSSSSSSSTVPLPAIVIDEVIELKAVKPKPRISTNLLQPLNWEFLSHSRFHTLQDRGIHLRNSNATFSSVPATLGGSPRSLASIKEDMDDATSIASQYHDGIEPLQLDDGCCQILDARSMHVTRRSRVLNSLSHVSVRDRNGGNGGRTQSAMQRSFTRSKAISGLRKLMITSLAINALCAFLSTTTFILVTLTFTNFFPLASLLRIVHSTTCVLLLCASIAAFLSPLTALVGVYFHSKSTIVLHVLLSVASLVLIASTCFTSYRAAKDDSQLSNSLNMWWITSGQGKEATLRTTLEGNYACCGFSVPFESGCALAQVSSMLSTRTATRIRGTEIIQSATSSRREGLVERRQEDWSSLGTDLGGDQLTETAVPDGVTSKAVLTQSVSTIVTTTSTYSAPSSATKKSTSTGPKTTSRPTATHAITGSGVAVANPPACQPHVEALARDALKIVYILSFSYLFINVIQLVIGLLTVNAF